MLSPYSRSHLNVTALKPNDCIRFQHLHIIECAGYLLQCLYNLLLPTTVRCRLLRYFVTSSRFTLGPVEYETCFTPVLPFSRSKRSASCEHKWKSSIITPVSALVLHMRQFMIISQYSPDILWLIDIWLCSCNYDQAHWTRGACPLRGGLVVLLLSLSE